MAGMKSVNIADPLAWLGALARAESLQVLMAFAVCVLCSWVIVWGIRKLFAEQDLSVLLGKRLIDGVLFPMLLLGLTFVARTLMTDAQQRPDVRHLAAGVHLACVDPLGGQSFASGI
jgi:hypothetical protein